MTTVATFAELLVRARGRVATQIVLLQSVDVMRGPVHEERARAHRRYADDLRAAITSAEALFKTGHAQEAFRHLSEVVGS